MSSNVSVVVYAKENLTKNDGISYFNYSYLDATKLNYLIVMIICPIPQGLAAGQDRKQYGYDSCSFAMHPMP
jgi:hypothetical protein